MLGALSIEPMSGYDIKNLLGRTVGHFWNEGYGQIYPTLSSGRALARYSLARLLLVAGRARHQAPATAPRPWVQRWRALHCVFTITTLNTSRTMT